MSSATNPRLVRHGAKKPSTRRRREVLEAALQVFAAKGFASTTMRDVADEAGILVGSVYHHFGSKDDILIEGLRYFYDHELHDIEAIVHEGRRPIETVERLLALAVKEMADRRTEARIILNDFAHLRRLPAFDFINQASRQAEEFWVDALQRAIDARELRDGLDPAMAYRSIMGAVFAAARWYDQRGDVDVDAFTKQVQRLYLDGVRTAPKRPPNA